MACPAPAPAQITYGKVYPHAVAVPAVVHVVRRSVGHDAGAKSGKEPMACRASDHGTGVLQETEFGICKCGVALEAWSTGRRPWTAAQYPLRGRPLPKLILDLPLQGAVVADLGRDGVQGTPCGHWEKRWEGN